MPITKSAKKALRQNPRRYLRNLRQRRSVKLLVKQYREALASRSLEKARQLLPKLYQALDKSAKRGRVLKPNTASRLKSRLTRALVALAKSGSPSR